MYGILYKFKSTRQNERILKNLRFDRKQKQIKGCRDNHNILYYNIVLFKYTIYKNSSAIKKEIPVKHSTSITKVLHHSTNTIRYFIHIGTNIQHATANPKFRAQTTVFK